MTTPDSAPDPIVEQLWSELKSCEALKGASIRTQRKIVAAKARRILEGSKYSFCVIANGNDVKLELYYEEACSPSEQ
jgi:hypothetical protein